MKLNQVLVVEKSVKQDTFKKISEIYKKLQKSEYFNGFYKKYTSIDEEGEKFSDENKKVLVNTKEELTKISKTLTELFDISYLKDISNTTTSADIIVDGVKLASNVPPTYILFLEKQLTDIKTMVNAIPTLDVSEDWVHDTNSGLYKSEPITTNRTKKQQKVLVKYEATKEHPAQTELVSEDILIGHWSTVKVSGALSIPDKEILVEKVNKLIKSVKIAREEANNATVEDNKIGESIFNYLFK